MRADYCGEVIGQWTATRSFRSVFPPDFNLNSVPAKVDFGRRVVIGGQLKNNGAAVKKARLYLERRIFPSDTFKAAGIVNTNNSGRFRFQLKMNRSADYRLVWRESASNPEGAAAFGIDVQPRVTFRLASSRVVRRKGLVVKGTVYPKRPGFVQIKTSDGWQNLRKVVGPQEPLLGGRSRPVAWTRASTSCASTCPVTTSGASSTRPASSAACSSTTSS